MANRKILYLLLLLVALVVIAFITKNFNLYNTSSNEPPDRQAHVVKFYDEKTFSEGVSRAKKDVTKLDYLVTGGIVPHDLFVNFIIADFFHRLSLQNPKTIIILGPNHYEKGHFEALTSLYGWNTAFGVVEPDESLTKTLVDKNLVNVDEEVLPNDHALSALMPFIKYYMPNTKVVPILLSQKLSKEQSEVLADNLSKLVTKDIVIVASVDFSHYLTSRQAKEKDEITSEVMREFDYRKLYTLNSDYLDSPASIGTLLMVMQRLNTTNMDLLYHTNSGELQNNNQVETTSYFSILFTE